jgi:hypothetical protein
MQSLTTFLLGAAAGIYADQNYNLPKVATFIDFAVEWMRKMEESLRKNGK